MIAATVTGILVELLVGAALATLLLWWRGQVREDVIVNQQYIDSCAADIETQRVDVAYQRSAVNADRDALDALIAANTERLMVERRSLAVQRNLIESLDHADRALRRLGHLPDPRHNLRDAALRLASDSDPTPAAGIERPAGAAITLSIVDEVHVFPSGGAISPALKLVSEAANIETWSSAGQADGRMARLVDGEAEL